MERTIVYFGNILFPDKDAASHRAIGNAKVLRELGYRVVLLGCREHESRAIIDTKESVNGFDTFYFNSPDTLSKWIDYLVDFSPLKSILGNEDDVEAVILYNHPAISSQRIMRFCHGTGIKVYADCTEWFNPTGFSFHSVIKKMDTWYRMNKVNKHLDGIISISSFLNNFYATSGVKTIIVPPLIDKNDKKWEISPSDRRRTETIKICYVGNPGAGSKDKISLILSSLNLIKQEHSELSFTLTIVGMTKEEYSKGFGESASKYLFASFMGRMPNLKALEIIKQSDYSIFLRDKNRVCMAGFPTKFSESIACGTPVLTNDTSDIHLYLQNGMNGYMLDVSSLENLNNSLYQALNISVEDRQKMKDVCRDYNAFDYHTHVESFRSFIKG